MRFRLDHVAIAVSDLDSAVANFSQRLGLHLADIEEVPTEKAKVAFFPVGDTHLELVAPTAADASVARSIAKRGEGLHHICLEVEDLAAAMALAQAAGLTLVNTTPVPGAKGSKVAFLHPKSLNGVLVELVEKAPAPSPEQSK